MPARMPLVALLVPRWGAAAKPPAAGPAGFDAVSDASSATRRGAIRSTSMIVSMPSSHAVLVKGTPGVQDIAWANWFGGIYKDPKNFFGQFAVEPESYLRMYPEIQLTPDEKKAFIDDRTGCIVGDGLARKYGFKVGHKLQLQVGLPVSGQRNFDFTIRGV